VREFPEFFDFNALDHHEFIPPGQNFTGHFYMQVLQRLCNAVRRKQRDKWQAGMWFLHHTNALNHTSLVVQQFLAEKNIPIITQPLYSPDLAPSGFWLFPTRFATMEDISLNVMAELRNIPKEAFRWCFQQWQD
jgi:hypothetical protein